MRKWIPAVLIAASYGFSVWAYPGLPDRVSPRWDALFPGVPASDAEAMPRVFAAFAIPTLALVVWMVLRGAASRAAERIGGRVLPAWRVSDRTGAGAVERFGPTFDLMVILVVGFVVLLHVVTLGAAIGWPDWTTRAFTGSIGVGIMVLGNIMPRTRPNWVAGLRTRATLSDPDLWRRTHRYFGAFLMVTGLVVIAASLISAPYAFLSAGAGFLLSALLASALGRRRPASAGEPPPLAGLVMVVLLAAAPVVAQGAPPVPSPGDVIEQAIEITSAGLTLPGTLTLPAGRPGPLPVCVIVAGSGPTDRNGNGPLAQTDLYAQLAHALARRGMASVRYDKRGIGEAARTIDHAALTLDDFVNDVVAVARVVAADERFSRVFLIGHSEGAGLVLQAANRGAPAAGIAMLSGTGRPLREVLHDQFATAVDSATVARIDTAFVRFLRGEEVSDAPEIARPVLVPGYRRLFVSMAAYDPEREIARARLPVLIVQGGMDLQITARDSDRLRAARPTAAWLPIPSANHVFKATASRDPAAQVPLYHDRTIPMVPELVAGIAAWIESLR